MTRIIVTLDLPDGLVPPLVPEPWLGLPDELPAPLTLPRPAQPAQPTLEERRERARAVGREIGEHMAAGLRRLAGDLREVVPPPEPVPSATLPPPPVPEPRGTEPAPSGHQDRLLGGKLILLPGVRRADLEALRGWEPDPDDDGGVA